MSKKTQPSPSNESKVLAAATSKSNSPGVGSSGVPAVQSNDNLTPLAPNLNPTPDFPAAPAPYDGEINRILIIGMSGYLGSSLALGLRDDFEVFGTYNKRPIRMRGTTVLPLDAMNTGDIVDTIKRVQPDIILYCAGIPDPETCQKEKDRADQLHVKAPSLVLKTSIRPPQFVYFSADQVFGTVPEGFNPPFLDRSPTSPINTLGNTKAQGESLVSTGSKGTHVLRCGPLFGEAFGSANGFRRTWIEGLIRRLDRGDKIFLPISQIRSHLYVGNFVRAVRAFLHKIPSDSSIYNLAPSDALTLVEFGKFFCEALGYDPELIRMTKEEDSLSAVSKSKNSSLSSRLFSHHFQFQFPTIRSSLQEFGDRLFSGQTSVWAPLEDSESETQSLPEQTAEKIT